MQNRLDDIVKNTVEGLGFELWGYEYRPRSESALLRIFIETTAENKDAGISVDNCASVSRQIGAVLDVENIIPVAYILEVSSPGMDRVLFKAEQYQEYIGSSLKIRTRTRIDDRRNFKGSLVSAGESVVTIKVDNQEFEIPYDSIDRARLVLD
ncbi:MAG TPA: ribosome maturation factor RimP [Leucothrix sp.]|nr:ribosome maturation factor RimP [Leucothrix sp.]